MGIYDSVRALRPRRSAFNLSHEVKLTCDLGQLIPIMCEEVVPGDTWHIGIEGVVRMMPMVAPILHQVDFYVHYFFCPYRLLDENWEDFITGGANGQDAHTMPVWTPTGGNVTNGNGVVVKDNGVGSLWDYFGFPVSDAGIIPTGVLPLAFPRRAYNLVFNEYYRDQTQIAEVSLDSSIVLQRAWEKDYFTSALPWQQRGIAPSLPISGSSAAVFAGAPYINGSGWSTPQVNPTSLQHTWAVTSQTQYDNWVDMLGDNTVDLSSATTFDVADLRLAFQIQKWMERNARGGARYTEFLGLHFGVAPRDERLQRPEYIGGTRMPVQVSEVLQTSSTDATSPQGNMAGHGLVAGRDVAGSYKAVEYGLIIGIMSIMPRSAYSQGVERQWLRKTRYDYYSPEWAHLSEQAVVRGELYATNTQAENETIFGYQGRYNEMRSRQSRTVALMRYGVTGSLGFWHLARHFASAPALNQTFIECIPRKDYLAVPTEPACIVNIANILKAVRPMPIEADPGLIDHS